MDSIYWALVMLAVSFVFGLAMGIFNIYSRSSETCNIPFWITSLISYLSFYAFGFVVVTCFIVYVLHASGSLIGIILLMAVMLICNLWIHYIPTIGVRLYNKHFLKLAQ